MELWLLWSAISFYAGWKLRTRRATKTARKLGYDIDKARAYLIKRDHKRKGID